MSWVLQGRPDVDGRQFCHALREGSLLAGLAPAAEKCKGCHLQLSPDASVAGRVCNLMGIDNAEKIKS